METIGSVIDWLASGAGAVIVVSWAASWLLEDVKAWADIDAKWKKLIILVVAVLVGLGGTVLQQNPEWVEAIKPYLDTLVLVVSAWLTTQVAHKADKSNTLPAG